MADLTIRIKPLEGVIFRGKEITFGMSQKDINSLLEKATKFEVSNLINLMIEPRDGTIFHYEFDNDFCINYGKEKLISIDVPIGSGMKIFYEDIDILHDKESILKLSEFDTPTADDGQFINFYKLGICLGGFGRKRVPEKKLVTVFPESQTGMFVIQYRSGGGRITHSVEDMRMWAKK